MAKTMRISLLLALMVVTGCRFVARQKTVIARSLTTSLTAPLTALQAKAPLTQSSFRNEVVTPRRQVKAAAKPAPVAAPEPDPEPQPIALAALRIPDNLPGVIKQARCPLTWRATRVRIENGHRYIIVQVDGDAPHPPIGG